MWILRHTIGYVLLVGIVLGRFVYNRTGLVVCRAYSFVRS